MVKTYGANGLMEWQCQIHSGKALFHIPFTGGTQTEYGVTPAKYTTANPVIQAVIERSDYFKSGRISLQRSPKAKTAARVAEPSKALVVKDFSTLADAKEWLASEFGAAKSGIRTVADAVGVGKANGVDVVVRSASKATGE